MVITMLPDDAAGRDVVFGREDLGVVGLASRDPRHRQPRVVKISTAMALYFVLAVTLDPGRLLVSG
jgi:hypothetical protein